MQHIAGLANITTDPSLATGVGLLLHGFKQQYEGGYQVPVSNDLTGGVWTRLKQWFNGNF